MTWPLGAPPVLDRRFFATLRAELVDHEKCTTHAPATASLGDYIDNFYNVARRHSHLGYLNLVELESRAAAARDAA